MLAEPDCLSAAFLDGLYFDYRKDPSSVSAPWRKILSTPPKEPSRGDGAQLLAGAYRTHGHLGAHLDPLSPPPPLPEELDPAKFGVGPDDPAALRLRETYCGKLGAEFMHLPQNESHWLRARMESTANHQALSPTLKTRILRKLSEAVAFESLLQKRFIGAKTFSLEGSEMLIPLLDLALEAAAADGVSDVVIAMAHRGRLNVLANVIGQAPREIFRMFRDEDPEETGDVKYHLGFSADRITEAGRRVHVSLCFNPSHVEWVGPVASGRVRARQDRLRDFDRAHSLAIIIHGDASFAGGGIVPETINLSGLSAYAVGGALHIVVNNQIGFTTPPHEARSGRYATEPAKAAQVPIFHVNGEDPEAVAQALTLAMECRRRFKRDAVIDLYGFRRRGHNETDEPSFTQPLMYRAIAQKPSILEVCREKLGSADAPLREASDLFERELLEAPATRARSATLQGVWRGFSGGREPGETIQTKLELKTARPILDALGTPPPDFNLHPTILKGLGRRRAMARGEEPLDWSAAEALAFGSLAAQGVRVRLTGQDAARGTFSQRHAVLFDQQTGEAYVPMMHAAAGQAPVEIFNSPLSEAAALGFEYGYSLDFPEALVLWEAQFGDFTNAAQVIVDQFLASAEKKWKRLSGLVLLLPHGLEGMGPEHSSARLERFLQLAAEHNIQIAAPTTAAQYFHLLRRQALRAWRKPLVVMTPKKLLRFRQSFSDLWEFSEGSFAKVLGDEQPHRRVRKAILCSGKVYHELDEFRRKSAANDVAIIRLEQLYPFPQKELERELAVFSSARFTYIQEEPANNGAWPWLAERFRSGLLGRRLERVSRPASASPAGGSAAAYRNEQERLVEAAFS